MKLVTYLVFLLASLFSTAVVAQSCSATPSTGVGVILTRACTASYVVGWPPTPTNGPVSDLSVFLGGGSYPNYTFDTIGHGISVSSASFVSLAFTPATNDRMYVQSNSSFGIAPLWSVSTAPGDFSTTLGKNCQRQRAATLYFSTDPIYASSHTVCYLPQSGTYYLNLSPVYIDGSSACKSTGCVIGLAVGLSVGVAH